MSLLFRDCEDLDDATLDRLTRVYIVACDELAADHYLSSSQLAGLIDEMTTAIWVLYRDSQCGQAPLAHHAVPENAARTGR